METVLRCVWLGCLAIGLGWPAGWAVGDAPPAETGLRVSGPYVHDNLTVFLLHRDGADDTRFITLDEGLKAGLVTVREREKATVRELIIENRSDLPLFLQEGDRLKGGKQDRTICNTMVVKPRSGQMPVPSFCIEASRWQEAEGGSLFADTSNAALAPKSVRLAAKAEKDQSKVWARVADLKSQAAQQMQVGRQTSSLNEALDSEQVMANTKPYEDALSHVVDQHPDAVGVVFAVNGVIEEANVYPGQALLKKVYPRLIKGYAVDAALHRPEGDEATPGVSHEQVDEFLTKPVAQNIRTEELAGGNRARMFRADELVRFESTYEGSPVHLQRLRVEPQAEEAVEPNAPVQQQRSR